ncbi:MAG TPA: hypothetical protein VGG33_03090, partial [Polyangia bacterium]
MAAPPVLRAPPPALRANRSINIDGTPVAVAASIAAGAVWGSGLAVLAQQNSTGVVTLLGTAGAIIGGGTAWGLTRFGYKPTPAQALFYANGAAWGSLAGLAAWGASGSTSPKLKYGLLVGGESLGIVGGIWAARKWKWTVGQIALADSLVVGAGLGIMGIDLLRHPEGLTRITPLGGYGAAPAMILAAAASRYVQPTARDLRMMAAASMLAGWSTSLISAGLLDRSEESRSWNGGGFLTGTGLGYLAATAAAPFFEVSDRRLVLGTAGMGAGNLLGLGASMLLDPEQDHPWSIGTGFAGLGLSVGAFALAPALRPGPRAPSMATTGALYGAGTWLLALKAGSTGQPANARVPGGAFAFGTAGAIAGVLASQWFAPTPVDQLTTGASTGLGMAVGLGTAKLVTDDKGKADFAGVVTGAALGFAGGALFSHANELRAPDVLAGSLGLAYGLGYGTLLPTLGKDDWENGRRTAGGQWLGLSLGALGSVAVTHFTEARAGQVAVPAVAGGLGAGMGVGLGMLLPGENSQKARVGAVIGSAGFSALALALDPALGYSDGLSESAGGLAALGTGLGALHGLLATDLIDNHEASDERRKSGVTILGTTLGLTSGLVLSKWLTPSRSDHFGTATASLFGLSLGQGIAVLAGDDGLVNDPIEPMARLGGSFAGLAAGAITGHFTDLRPVDFASATLGGGYGLVMGLLVPSLDDRQFRIGESNEGFAQLGLGLGGIVGAGVSHLTGATGRDLLLASAGLADGLMTGIGVGLLFDADNDSGQGRRLGTTLGATAGLAVGSALWTQLTLGPGDRE